jgi:hypothetical protein
VSGWPPTYHPATFLFNWSGAGYSRERQMRKRDKEKILLGDWKIGA